MRGSNGIEMAPKGSISASYANVDFLHIPETYKLKSQGPKTNSNYKISMVDLKPVMFDA